MHLAAQAWCTAETEKITMDGRLAKAFAQILLREAFSPNLGLATNRELLNELSQRIQFVGPGLDYRTADDYDKEKPKAGSCWRCSDITSCGDGGFWLCLDCQKKFVKEKDAQDSPGMPPDQL